MEYSKEAMEKVEELVKKYRNELLAEAMNFAAVDLDTKAIEAEHIDLAFAKVWDLSP